MGKYNPEQRKARINRLKAAGTCTRCQTQKAKPGRVTCVTCLAGLAKTNPDRVRARAKRLEAEGLCNRCGKNEAKPNRKNCKGCIETETIRGQELRARVMTHYGSRCVCCGELEQKFLTLDHVNNDGAAHRKTVRSGKQLCSWAINNGFPNTLQILCFNCNCGRQLNGGVCPHKTKTENRR